MDRRRALAAAAPLNDLLREAVEALDCNYAIFDPSRALVDWSASYTALHQAAFGSLKGQLRYDDLMREAIRQTMPDASVAEAEAELARRIDAHESPTPGQFDRLYPDGRWMRVAKYRLSGGFVAGVALDITALKQREMAIAASDARFRALIDTAPVGIWHLDEEGQTLFANARLAALYGGEPPASLSDVPLRRQDVLVSNGPFGFPPGREVEAVIPGGNGRPQAHVLVCASDWFCTEPGGRRGAVLTFLDITPLKLAQARAEHLAWHDPLTGLANRAQFQAALDSLQPGDNVALLLVDLDHFKSANDRHGHAAGDAVLREAASRLNAAAQPDDLPCRLGGDEFAILLRGPLGAARARAVADALARSLVEPTRSGAGEITMSASIGHAAYGVDAADAEALQRMADLALYAAKQAGRGRAVRFHPDLLAASERRHRMGEALAAALAADRLSLAWQPQMMLPGHALRGAEALIRWPDCPLLGRDAGPGEFLPDAEAAGLMPAIDAWVLETALAQARAWRDQPGAPPVVAINVSAATLADADFPARVAGALVRHGLPARVLEIEIPENVATRDLDRIAPVLEELAALGVPLALDDFGGGLSSLSHLVRLPVSLVKLDRSIVAGLPNGRERTVLRAVIALAGSLAIPVLAEGIETDAQVFALRREGCTIVQGYLFGRPMSAEALTSAVRVRQAS